MTTISEICTKHHISPEQFDKATHCSTGTNHYYIVESQTESGKEYHVSWNSRYKVLQCTCKASDNGLPCWHKRAALAAEEHYKATQRARRLNEQATIEATEEYRWEQYFRDLEDALDALDALAKESDRRAALRSAC